MKPNYLRSTIIFICITTLISLLGGYLIFHATNWGPWAFSDSAAYVSAARNFNAGKGFVIVNSNNSLTQVTEFPPFYPIFLSYFLGGEGNLINTLRWIDIFLFVAFLWIYGSMLFHITKNNFLVLLGLAFCLSSPILLQIFSGVMSETLFFPLLYGIFLLAIHYFQDNKVTTYVLLAVLSALLPITRYAGALFTVVIAILIFFLTKSTIKQKIRRSILYLASSLLPLAVWFTKLYLLSNKVGGKSLKLGFDFLKNILYSLAAEFDVLKTWLPYYDVYDLPLINKALVWGGLLAAAMILIYVYHNYRRTRSHSKPSSNYVWFFLSLINLCAYLLFIAYTHSITIPQIDIIDRMLAPIIPLALNLLILAIAILIKNRHKILISLVLVASIIVLRFNFMTSSVFLDEMYTDGHGYSAREYQESGFLQQLMSLPDDQRMLSNNAAFVLYFTNRFPMEINQFANRPYGFHNGYGEKTFRERGAALILLFPDFINSYGDTADQLLATVIDGLDVQYQDEIGGIYFYPSQEATQP